MDPFSEEPLHYNTPNFEKLLVRYAPIEEVDEILEKIYQEKERLLRRRYYVIGLRGMGKTTILNYILRKIHEEHFRRILPIYVNNVHSKDPGDPIDPAKDSEKLRLNFCLRTIEALFNTVLHTFKEYTSEYSSIEKARKKYYELKGKILIDQSTAENLLKEYLNRLKKDFDLFLLLYDELDKIDEYDIVLKFLRSSQGLLETLSEYGCVLFICGVPDFSKMLHSSEYSGVSGHEIWIKRWSPQDARTLIKSRLDYALFAGEFPFEDKVIEAICDKAEGRPRLIQSEARDALIWGAYSGVKRIDEKFLGSFMWKDNSILRFQADIQNSKELREGANILRKIYDPDYDDPSIYFLMIKMFEVGRIFSTRTNLKEKYGIDIEAERFERLIYLLKDFDAVNERQTSGKKYYVLNDELQYLFSYVKNTLKESLEYLPRAIKFELKEVKESKIEFNLRNEVTKILVTNPHHRYRRSDLVKEIMRNPDAKIRALEHYKVASERELKSKLMSAIATVIRTLQKEGVIIPVSQGNRISYQFFEALEEMSWVKNLLLDEDVLQNYQSAINTFKKGDLSGTIPLLRLSVENALRHLAEVCQVELHDKAKLDTLGPINDSVYRAKVYDQGLKTMIDAFNIEVGPICHGAVKLEDIERAKNLIERAQIIIRKLYIIKKERMKS
jgi:Cdc6-like AAA superfamily ATPase